MQTFLPYESFARSAEVLDRQRLGKQRVEALQILRVLACETPGYRNHPAVGMWRGYELSLIDYGLAVCDEWHCERGYRDTCSDKIAAFTHNFRIDRGLRPEWLGDQDFHLAHQSNLLRKDPAHYGPLFPGVPDDLPYVWPSS